MKKCTFFLICCPDRLMVNLFSSSFCLFSFFSSWIWKLFWSLCLGGLFRRPPRHSGKPVFLSFFKLFCVDSLVSARLCACSRRSDSGDWVKQKGSRQSTLGRLCIMYELNLQTGEMSWFMPEINKLCLKKKITIFFLTFSEGQNLKFYVAGQDYIDYLYLLKIDNNQREELLDNFWNII